MPGLSPLHTHWYYVWVPIITAFVWVGTLLAMLITWLAQGRPKYVTMDGMVTYISDVGADILKPLFVVGCCITGVGFIITLVVERWLRHEGRYGPGISSLLGALCEHLLEYRLPPDMRVREKVFSVLAILSSVVAGAGLILLSIFDTKHYTTLHRLFLLVFMLGVWFTAMCSVVEVRCWRSVRFSRVDHTVPVPLALKGLPGYK